MTFWQELRNSNYCNTTPRIADFVLELMVVCRQLYDLGDFVSIFRFNLIRYECKSKKDKEGRHLVNICYSLLCLRPYHPEYTSSRLITEVKQGRAMSVLGWVTA